MPGQKGVQRALVQLAARANAGNTSLAMNRLTSRLQIASYLTTATAASAYFVFSVKFYALTLPTLHIDGAFQTASGLFRLSSGELPGRDFFPYLGIGPLFLVYPLFVIGGGDLAASVIAAHSLVLMTLALCLSAIVYFWIPKDLNRRGLTSVAIGFTAAAAMLAMRGLLPYWVSDSLLSPGNSLRPLRSALPYAAAIAFYVAATRRSRSSPYVVLGLLAGIATLWSNDFAAPTILACLCGAVGIAYSRREGYSLPAALFAGSFLLASSLFAIATAGEVTAMLRYNFGDVATDQWWYFGPWDEGSKIFSPLEVGKMLEPAAWFGLGVLAVLAGCCYWRPSVELFAQLLLGSTLFLGAALATIGGHLGGYFMPFFSWSVATALVAAVAGVLRFAGIRLFTGLVWVMPVIALTLAFSAWKTSGGAARYLSTDPQWIYVRELGGYLRQDWKAYVETARATPPGRELEEYWGIWSAIRRPKPLLPVDSVIHALGAVRDRATAVIDSLPDSVVTTQPSFSDYPIWSFSANYWLYQRLLQNYKIDVTGPHTITWKRTEAAPPWADTSCTISEGAVDLGKAPRGFYEVTLAYSVPKTGRHIALIRNGIVQIALPNTANRVTMPFFVTGSAPERFEMTSLPSSSNQRGALEGCSAKAIPADAVNGFVYPDAALPLSDETWLRGVGRTEPKLAITASPSNIDAFEVGRTVVVADGERRTIVGAVVDSYKLRLVVELDGAALQADLVGYPHRIMFAP